MFLFAKLVMSNLERQPNMRQLRQEFHHLPEGLDEAYVVVPWRTITGNTSVASADIWYRYGRHVDRFNNNESEGERVMARMLLSLMVCSRRPLRWRELQAAISIDPDDQTIDPSRRLVTNVENLCGSLVEVLPGDRVDFIHVTACWSVEHSHPRAYLQLITRVRQVY